MVWTGRIKKFLKVISRLSCLALETVLGGNNKFLVATIRCLVIVIINSNRDLLGVLLLAPLPTALGGAPRLPPWTVFLSL
jgi:hypothetical protein